MQSGTSKVASRFGLKPFKLRRVINPLIAFGSISLSSWLYWEWIYRRPFKRSIKSKEAQFNGETAFYGKTWGNSTDYLIEQSLKEGDVLFFSYNSNSLHFHQAIVKYVLNSISGINYDEVGIIHVKDSIKHILSIGPFTGVKLTRYSDKLATADSTTIALRRLQYVNPEIREHLKEYIDSNLQELKTTKFSIMSTIWWNLLRIRTNSVYFSKVDSMIGLEWDKRALKIMNQKLYDLIETEKENSTANDQSVSSSRWIFPITWLKNAIFKTPAPTPSKNLEIEALINKNLNRIDLIDLTISKLQPQNHFPGIKPQETLKDVTFKNFILSYTNSLFLHSKKHSSASFITDILIKMDLLPVYVPSIAWTINDLNSIKTLYSKCFYTNHDYKSSTILPILSLPFYIRQDDTERQIKRH